jgi:hypothetical protein
MVQALTCFQFSCYYQDDCLTLQTLPSSYQYRKLVEPLTRLRSWYSYQDAHLTPRTFTCYNRLTHCIYIVPKQAPKTVYLSYQISTSNHHNLW